MVLGAVYKFVDGVVAGLLSGWLYSAFDGAVQEPFLGKWRLFGTLPIPGTLTGGVSTQRPSCRARGQPSRC